MNNYLYLKVTNHLNRFISKALKSNISLLNIEYLDENTLIVKINMKDYKHLKRINYQSKIKIIKYQGPEGLKNHFKRHLMTYITILLCFILMDVITSYIIRIDIIHENSSIRKLIKEELAHHNIKTFTLARDFFEIEKIKNLILEDNQDQLEWLSITRFGMTYEVRVEERIITKPEKETGYAHIIATRDALITKINADAGHVLIRSGDYVKKGDILITGEIKLGEDIKENIRAKGEVFGDVWYNVNIKYPIDYEHKTFTGRKRLNFSINNKIIFLNKYQYFEQKNIRKINILGLKITIYNEIEYHLEQGKYTNQ